MAGSIRQRMNQYLTDKKDDHVYFLKQLVGFDSRIINDGATGKEGEIQKFIANKLSEMGADELDIFEPENDKIKDLPGFNPNHDYTDRPNVVAVFKGSGGGRSLLINGHCDVVDTGNESLWTSGPFSCEERDGYLFGRGTADMKGGLGSAILALEAIRKMGIKLAGDVILTSVVDEEAGGNGTLACVEKGYRADGALIMEPTGLEVHAANRGAFLAEFKVVGKPIHASLKGFGVNAIDKAYKLINALYELEKSWLLTKRHPLLSNPTINVGQIFGGDGASTAAGECTVRFDVEFFPREYDVEGREFVVDKNQVKQEVQDWLTRSCEGDEWLCDHPVQIHWYQDTSAFQTDLDHPMVTTALDSVKRSLGKVTLSGFPAGCDGVYLANIGQMPVIIFGPGRIHQAHTVNEYLEVKQYLDHIKATANFIIDWVGIAGGVEIDQ